MLCRVCTVANCSNASYGLQIPSICARHMGDCGSAGLYPSLWSLTFPTWYIDIFKVLLDQADLLSSISLQEAQKPPIGHFPLLRHCYQDMQLVKGQIQRRSPDRRMRGSGNFAGAAVPALGADIFDMLVGLQFWSSLDLADLSVLLAQTNRLRRQRTAVASGRLLTTSTEDFRCYTSHLSLKILIQPLKIYTRH